jgi:AcrR family transcriptional regulator
MAKAFTKSEKEQVRNNLLKKGREYFIRYGLKKTSIDDVARATGIAKGTFYTFFESKEAFFLAVHELSEEKLRAELLNKLEEIKEPHEKLRTFLKAAFAMLEEDPLMRAVFSNGGLDGFSGFIASRPYEEHYHEGISMMKELIRQWQEEGIVRQVDPEVAGNMITSTFFIYLQKETLGDEMYKKVTEMLIESLVNYLSEKN